MNEQYERMRNDHKRIGLSADRALAWHEMGHGLPATHLKRLTSIELFPANASLGGRAHFDPDRLSLPEDYSIAVMGPAAQLLYTDRFAVPPPSFDFRRFVEHYVMRPALSGDLTLLRSRWPGVNIADGDFRRSILMLADSMNADGDVFTWLSEASEALVAKGTIKDSELPPPPHGLTMLLDGLRETFQQ